MFWVHSHCSRCSGFELLVWTTLICWPCLKDEPGGETHRKTTPASCTDSHAFTNATLNMFQATHECTELTIRRGCWQNFYPRIPIEPFLLMSMCWLRVALRRKKKTRKNVDTRRVIMNFVSAEKILSFRIARTFSRPDSRWFHFAESSLIIDKSLLWDRRDEKKLYTPDNLYWALVKTSIQFYGRLLRNKRRAFFMRTVFKCVICCVR